MAGKDGERSLMDNRLCDKYPENLYKDQNLSFVRDSTSGRVLLKKCRGTSLIIELTFCHNRTGIIVKLRSCRYSFDSLLFCGCELIL
uniref:Uncharacterized protein n=1 Tax=Strigamia maritima TaxID=126957 RepID=T1IHE3_STRMM